jgi:UDP-glucose 4-epimerase
VASSKHNLNDGGGGGDHHYDNDVSLYIDDIRHREALTRIFTSEGIDTCFHLASKISVPESIRNPGETIDVNIKGTFNVLEACSAVNVKNLLFASSSAVYGEPPLDVV